MRLPQFEVILGKSYRWKKRLVRLPQFEVLLGKSYRWKEWIVRLLQFEDLQERSVDVPRLEITLGIHQQIPLVEGHTLLKPREVRIRDFRGPELDAFFANRETERPDERMPIQ